MSRVHALSSVTRFYRVTSSNPSVRQDTKFGYQCFLGEEGTTEPLLTLYVVLAQVESFAGDPFCRRDKGCYKQSGVAA